MGCCHYDHDNSLHCFLAASQTNDWVNIRRVHNDRDEASKGHVIVILRVTDATDYDGGTPFCTRLLSFITTQIQYIYLFAVHWKEITRH